MQAKNLKVLVVEDEEKISEVVKSYLENSGYRVHQAFNGNEAIEQFNRINPSLIILDLMLPDLAGEEICKTIRKKSRVPIIMVTAKIEEEDILKGLDMGADDYITKPFSPRQLVSRIAAVLRRTLSDVSLLTNILAYNGDDLVIDNTSHQVRKNGKIVNLTATEYKVLVTIVKYPNKAFSREELLVAALGDDYDGFDRVIDTHVKNLRQKIEDNPRTPKYILTVHGIGYKFGGERSED